MKFFNAALKLVLIASLLIAKTILGEFQESAESGEETKQSCRARISRSSEYANGCECLWTTTTTTTSDGSESEEGSSSSFSMSLNSHRQNANVENDLLLLSPSGVEMRCENRAWTTLPNVSAAFGAGTLDRQNLPPLIKFAATDGELSALPQDSFRREPRLQTIDLSGNALTSAGVNANAFRGLETTLFSLDLSRNRLESVPRWALAALAGLGALRLAGNRLDGALSNSTFAECHRLVGLRLLQLDENQLSVLGADALRPLAGVQALTLAANRLHTLHETALPRRLELLDLRENRFEEIPYRALTSLNRLRMLDLTANNIVQLANARNKLRRRHRRKQKQQSASLVAPSAQLPVVVDGAPPLDLRLAHNRIQRIEQFALEGFGAREVSRLDLCHNQISYVNEKALQSLSTLVELELCANSIRELHPATFTRAVGVSLQRLNLEANRFAAFPSALRGLRALRHLNLNQNRLSYLNPELVENFKSTLNELHLSGNRLNAIPTDVLEGMHELRVLDLSQNNIEHIGQMGQGGSALLRLNMAGNRIRDVLTPSAFLYLSRLTLLDLSDNAIRRVSKTALERLESLEWLSLSGNKIVDFPHDALSALPRLRMLSMNSNRVRRLPADAFEWAKQLEHLLLANNRLRTIDASAFRGGSPLQTLDLSHNRLERVPNKTFSDMWSLEQLDLSHNAFTAFGAETLGSLPNLRQISLAHNAISDVEPFAFARHARLETISLANNRLRTIRNGAFKNLTRLIALDLSGNLLERFSFDFLDPLRNRDEPAADTFSPLEHLNLAGNALRTLTIAKKKLRSKQFALPRFRVLDLSRNALDAFPGHALLAPVCESLRELHLGANRIRALNAAELRGFDNLTLLDLSDNGIDTLEDETFANLPSLLVLDLSGNPLDTISPHAFLGLSAQLVELRLANTGLFSMPRLPALKRMRALDVSGNRLSALVAMDFEGVQPAKLLSLDVSGNVELGTMPTDVLALFPSMRVLNISGTSVDGRSLNANWFKHLGMLETLNMDEMLRLEHLPDFASSFALLDNLKHFHMSRVPRIESASLRNFTADLFRRRASPLEALHIGWRKRWTPNPLAQLDVRKLRDLEIVAADDGDENTLDELDFDELPTIRAFHFRLALQGFAKVPPLVRLLKRFRGVARLELSLRGSSIETLDLSSSSTPPHADDLSALEAKRVVLSIMEHIDLRGNPLSCDCRFAWLTDWIEIRRRKAVDGGPDEMQRWAQQRHVLAETFCERLEKSVANSVSDRDGVADNFSSVKASSRTSLLRVYEHARFAWLNRNVDETKAGGTNEQMLDEDDEEEGEGDEQQQSTDERRSAKLRDYVCDQRTGQISAASGGRTTAGEATRTKDDDKNGGVGESLLVLFIGEDGLTPEKVFGPVVLLLFGCSGIVAWRWLIKLGVGR